MLLHNLRAILVKPRFPENIGKAARACANMGCESLGVVCPERWKAASVYSLATPKGAKVIDQCKFFPDLRSALATSHRAFAATARTGGWRKRVMTPENCAREAVDALRRGEVVSLVFGPEDKGLTNAEISICGNIVNIPAYGEASSLNLAQATLIILYECAKLYNLRACEARLPESERVRMGDMESLEREFKDALILLDCLHGKNPDYYFSQWRSLLDRLNLNRKEYSSFMGLCRQIKNRLKKDMKCLECDIIKKQ